MRTSSIIRLALVDILTGVAVGGQLGPGHPFAAASVGSVRVEALALTGAVPVPQRAFVVICGGQGEGVMGVIPVITSQCISPMHFLPLDASRNPAGQEQRKPPGLLEQLPSHPPLSCAHSSTSINTEGFITNSF